MPSEQPPDSRRGPSLRKGPIKGSRRVEARIKAAGTLCGAIKRHEATVREGLSARLGSELRDGEAVPDPTLTLALVARSVRTAIDALVVADESYCGLGVQRRFLAEACLHVAREEIYPELADVRRAIDARFGKEGGRSVHRMQGHTRRKPKRQQPQLARLVASLKRLPKWPTPLRPGPPGESAGWLRQLEPGYDKLTQMLDDLQALENQEATLRLDRDFELESFDVVYGEALAFVRSVFQLAGVAEKEIWKVLPEVQRRRLRGRARRQREARAEGRQPPKPEIGVIG